MRFDLHAESFAFNSIINSYQSGDYETTRDLLEKALGSQPHNSYLIYNLGIAQYKLGKVGTALGLWRKAVHVNPGLQEAKEAIRYAIGQMPVKPPESLEASFYSRINDRLAGFLSINLIWPAFLFFVILFFKNIFCYFRDRRTALLEEKPLPKIKSQLFVFSLCALLFGALLLSCLREMVTVQATATTTVSARTGPHEDNAALYEFSEGTNLILTKRDGEWYRAEDPRGYVGWVNKSGLFVTTEKSL